MSTRQSTTRWSCVCLSCVFSRAAEQDLRPEAEEHHKQTGHPVLVQKLDSWTYSKPLVTEGRPFTLRL